MRYQAADQHDEDQDRKRVSEIEAETFMQADSSTGIRLVKIVIKAPSELCTAEDDIYESADRQQQWADDKILEIKDPLAADIEAAPHIEA